MSDCGVTVTIRYTDVDCEAFSPGRWRAVEYATLPGEHGEPLLF